MLNIRSPVKIIAQNKSWMEALSPVVQDDNICLLLEDWSRQDVWLCSYSSQCDSSGEMVTATLEGAGHLVPRGDWSVGVTRNINPAVRNHLSVWTENVIYSLCFSPPHLTPSHRDDTWWAGLCGMLGTLLNQYTWGLCLLRIRVNAGPVRSHDQGRPSGPH